MYKMLAFNMLFSCFKEKACIRMYILKNLCQIVLYREFRISNVTFYGFKGRTEREVYVYCV